MTTWTFPTPYCLLVRASVRHDRFNDFKAAAGRIAAAYHQHPTSRPWAAYATVAGPALYAYVLIPLSSMTDIDAIAPLDQVMTDIYGADAAADINRFRESVLDMGTSVLNSIALDMAPVDMSARPPEFLYYVNLVPNPAKAGRFTRALKLAASAQPRDRAWFVYGTFAGINRIHGFAPGTSIGALESITSMEEMVTRNYGNELAADILADLQDGIVSVESSILRCLGYSAS